MKWIFLLLPFLVSSCSPSSVGLHIGIYFKNRVDVACVKTQAAQVFPEVNNIEESSGSTWTELKFRLKSIPEYIRVGALINKGSLVNPEDSIMLGYGYSEDYLTEHTSAQEKQKIEEELRKLTAPFDSLSKKIVELCGAELKKEIYRKCNGACVIADKSN